MRTTTGLLVTAVLAVGAALLAARSRADVPHHVVPASRDGNLVVGLCDGQTSAEVAGVKAGTRLSRAQAQEVSDRLMAEWRRKNPDARWDDAPIEVAQAEHGTAPAPAAPQPGAGMEARPGAGEAAPAAAERTQSAPTPGQAAAQGATAGGAGGLPSAAQGPVQEGQTYGGFTARDEALWKASIDAVVDQGNRIFHSSDLLGGTIGVSCDMCHPNAANTHPETYPKFQVQFGRVALLRDMINWCIENPVRGRPLHDDDPKLRALEAYILAQRKGTPLEYGKH